MRTTKTMRSLPRPTTRLLVEALEDRLAPATLQVVGTAGNGTTSFNTFADAYNASNSADDIIVIEPGAGNIGAITLNNANKALTVMGDESFGTSSTAEAVSDVSISVSGVSLRHLYVGGTVTLSAGVGTTSITDVKLGGFTETAGAGNGNNTLERDTIRGNVVLQGGTTSASTGDQVLDCVFNAGAQLQIGRPGAAASGVQVKDTSFEVSPTTSLVITDSQNITIEETQITLSTAEDAVVINNTTGTLALTGLRFLHDDIRSESGTGIHITLTATGSAGQLGLILEGNAFQGNTTAVSLTGNADLPSGSVIDAGGGGSSIGGNEFRLQVTTGISIDDAALTAGSLSVFAKFNSVGSNVTLVNAGNNVNVTQGPNLTDQQAFIQSLYHDFLSHTATVKELNYWVDNLSGLGAEGVSNAIMHSVEGLTHLLQGLYSTLLGRDLDTLGQTYFIRLLLNGQTEEQVIEQILSSPEFANHANSLVGTPGASADLNFVRALYLKLLGRTDEGTAGDNYWLSVLSSQNRSSVVAGFLASQEFRSDYVDTLYSDYASPSRDSIFGAVPDLLCRSIAPPAPETSFWWMGPLDMLAIAQGITASAEYFSVR